MERYVFSNEARAEVALKQMNQIIELYGVATRADMKNIYGIASTEEDKHFGWTDLSKAIFEVEHVNFEVVLALPHALRLE